MGLETVKSWDDFSAQLNDPGLWETEEARLAVLAGVEKATASVVDDGEKLEKARKFLSAVQNGLKLIPGLLV